VSVRAVDTGGTAGGGINTSPAQTFSITVASVNDPPSFTGGANQTVREDSGAQSVAHWATGISPGPAAEAGQSVSFTVSSDTPGLFAAGGQPAVSANGTQTFTPAPDANGIATVSVSAVDDGGVANGGVDTSALQALTISVTAVNDPPSFAAGSGQVVLEDAGAQSIAGWATGISPGPADEAGQSVSFTVSSDNPGLFAVGGQPAVSTNGMLTFTPAPDANGTATVSVSAVDDGGTANGGVDTSVTQTMQISVAAVNDAPSFAAGADQTVAENTGPQSVSGWATAISAGPGNEAGQTSRRCRHWSWLRIRRLNPGSSASTR
jgi:hypothetical protein